MYKTPLSLWLALIGSTVLCVQPFDFMLNLVGFVLAALSGFSLIFVRRRMGRSSFVVFDLLFIAAIAVTFVNMGTLR